MCGPKMPPRTLSKWRLLEPVGPPPPHPTPRLVLLGGMSLMVRQKTGFRKKKKTVDLIHLSLSRCCY